MDAIVEAAHHIAQLGFTPAAAGNISARSDTGFCITTAGAPMRTLGTDHVVALSWDELDATSLPVGTSLPSSELALHAAILRTFPEIGAVVHCHAPHATAWAACRKPIPALIDEAIAQLGGDVECTQYEPSGTTELAAAAVGLLRDRSAVLLAHHGLVCVGATVADAVARTEVAEHAAHVASLACALASPVASLACALASPVGVPAAGVTHFEQVYRARRYGG